MSTLGASLPPLTFIELIPFSKKTKTRIKTTHYFATKMIGLTKNKGNPVVYL